MRGKACTPSSVMRNVCRPGTDAWPRSFMTCSFRTIEFRSTCWYSQKRPSATVNTGLSRISPSVYSPIRNVVACQLVRCRASRWTNPWSSASPVPPAAFRTTVRNESTTTTPGLAASTSLTISSSTASRSFSSTTWLRLTNRTAVFSLAGSKNRNCCWYRSILRAGSPSTVKYRAGRSGVALANTTWWASVVFPPPGAPAMMLNEYSGSPPPRISSSPGTPVGSFRIVTRSSALMVVPRLSDPFRPRARRATRRAPGAASGLADERHQQPEQVGHDGDSRRPRPPPRPDRARPRRIPPASRPPALAPRSVRGLPPWPAPGPAT